jgi:hypothetical protein
VACRVRREGDDVIASLPLALALSAVFVLSGAYALVRWSATTTASLPFSRRMATLAPPTMSVAMLVMTWTWAGTTGVGVQIALFTVFAGYFAVDAVQRYRTGSYGCADGCAHAVMAAASAWMLVAVPRVMPAPVSASPPGPGSQPGLGSGAAMDMGTPTGGAGWPTVVTVGVGAAVLATSAFWASRALRRPTVLAGAALVEPADVVRTGLQRNGTRPASAPAAAPAPTACATAEPASATHPLLGPRTDAGCHALMGLGMIAMLLAMVGGW